MHQHIPDVVSLLHCLQMMVIAMLVGCIFIPVGAVCLKAAISVSAPPPLLSSLQQLTR